MTRRLRIRGTAKLRTISTALIFLWVFSRSLMAWTAASNPARSMAPSTVSSI